MSLSAASERSGIVPCCLPPPPARVRLSRTRGAFARGDVTGAARWGTGDPAEDVRGSTTLKDRQVPQLHAAASRRRGHVRRGCSDQCRSPRTHASRRSSPTIRSSIIRPARGSPGTFNETSRRVGGQPMSSTTGAIAAGSSAACAVRRTWSSASPRLLATGSSRSPRQASGASSGDDPPRHPRTAILASSGESVGEPVGLG